jgi:hypothetical protein
MAEVGLKVTLKEQLPPALSEVPQLLLCVKFAAMDTADIESAAPPVFVRVTACAPLVVPTVWLLNVSDAGATVTAVVALAPVPAREML